MNEALLPSEYVDRTHVQLDMPAFVKAFYRYLPDDAHRLTDAQLSRLFEMVSDYRKLFVGIGAIRRSKVVRDLKALERLVRTANEALKAVIPTLQRLAARGGPHTDQAQFIPSEFVRLQKRIKWQFPLDRLHELHGQVSWASKLLQDPLEQEFFWAFEKLLCRYIRPFDMSEKKQQEYVNRVIAGIMTLNDPRRRTDVPDKALTRARQLRYKARRAIQRRPKQGELGSGDSEEFTDYIQVEQRYTQKLKKKKQKAATNHRTKKKQKVARRSQK